MLNAYFTTEELNQLGFAQVGLEVKVSRKVSVYNPNKISIGDFTRIDDFCVLSAGEGGIEIGHHVHIAVFALLIGKGRIKVGDFVNLSSRVAVYSSNDDYSGEYMAGPVVDKKYTNITSAPVYIGKHSIIGSGSVILPGITIGDGVSIGALSLINKDCEPFKVYAGIPAKLIKDRSTRLLELEKQFLEKDGRE